MQKRFFALILGCFALFSLHATYLAVNHTENNISVLKADEESTILKIETGNFSYTPVTINGVTYNQLHLEKAVNSHQKGEPALPYFAKSLIIGDNALVTAEVLETAYQDVSLNVAPSKGIIPRNVDPQTIPYEFSSTYRKNEFYPAENVRLSEPFIMRDFRGITLNVTPFSYNPQTSVLRVMTSVVVRVKRIGTDVVNIKERRFSTLDTSFSGFYGQRFLNYSRFMNSRYNMTLEQGKLLVICYDDFMAAIGPYVEWKKQMGWETLVYPLSQVGTSASQIASFIRTQYQTNNVGYVQLVGDAPQIPTLTSDGGGSDPSYALVDGNDSYPDLFIGRFSAQSVADVQTQVNRTIYYERDISQNATWLNRAAGIASNEGGGTQGDEGQSDRVHIAAIRDSLLTYGYETVDELYQSNNVTVAQISSAINNGRGLINYIGHGSETSWYSVNYTNSDVNALTNINKLPVIMSVACVNGSFTSMTCFAEAWLRATNQGLPTGAIAMYASSINQSWDSPMEAQDELCYLLRNELCQTVGGLFYNSSCAMMEEYGSDGISMYKTWHIFGDASLMYRTKAPQLITADNSPVLFIGVNNYSCNVGFAGAHATLMFEGEIIGKAISNQNGLVNIAITDAPQTVGTATLTVTAFNKVTYVAQVNVMPNEGAWITLDGITIEDGNNAIADYNETCNLRMVYRNVGQDNSSPLTMVLTTDDPYIQILNDVYETPSILAGGTLNPDSYFTVKVAANAPDRHIANLNLTITDTENNSWQVTYGLTLNAPHFLYNTMRIEEPSGNNRIDPGESIRVLANITNNGHADAVLVTCNLVSSYTGISLTNPTVSLNRLSMNETTEVGFDLTVAGTISAGIIIPLGLSISDGAHVLTQNLSLQVGNVADSFESGDFSVFGWQTGTPGWSVENTGAPDGQYCAKAGIIGSNGNTYITVTVNVSQAGEMSFMRKVSSEEDYDYLKFSIDNIQQDQWSGLVDWDTASYPITAGQHTLKWTYTKDGYLSENEDTAWIDNIQLPGINALDGPMFNITEAAVNFDPIFINTIGEKYFSLQNFGNAELQGTIEIGSPFCLTFADATSAPQQSLTYSVAPGVAVAFKLLFAPTEIATFNSTMLVTSNDNNAASRNIAVSGTCIGTAQQDETPQYIKTELLGNYPNPFNPTTTIRFNLADNAQVEGIIYNVKGQKVKTLVKDSLNKGKHQFVWNGTNDNGKKTSSGIYFFNLQCKGSSGSGKYTATRKMILLK